MHEKRNKQKQENNHFILSWYSILSKIRIPFPSSALVIMMPLFSDKDDDVILILRTTLILEQKVVVRQIRFGLNTQGMNSVQNVLSNFTENRKENKIFLCHF